MSDLSDQVTAVPVVTVDGPVGSGKGTISARMAQTLGFHLLDSGALYRALALAAEHQGIALDDETGLVTAAAGLSVSFQAPDLDQPVRVFVVGEDVDKELRSERCGQRASVLAAMPAIRAALLDRQRAFVAAPGLVADGRDMGSVVFPAATVKVFLIASAEERARRRYKQLIGKGIGVNLATLLGEIKERDRCDIERAISPLKPASDAVTVDSTGLEIDAVFAAIMELLAARGLLPPKGGG